MQCSSFADSAKIQKDFLAKTPFQLHEIARTFRQHGFSAWAVGGAVRDFFLNKPLSDWDIATDAPPDVVCSLFKRTVPTGIAHGTVTILYKGMRLECTTFRADSDYSDGRRPDSVEYSNSIEQDLSRRDFTMNAIAFNLTQAFFVDPFNGRQAIARRLIQTVGEPSDRFSEDGLRLLRAVRFAAVLEFGIEKKTYGALAKKRSMIKNVSSERIRDELVRIMGAERPSIGLHILQDVGLLNIILPELSACVGLYQGRMHNFDVFTHTLHVCDATQADNETVRLAALFHDIGKALVREVQANGHVSFFGHEAVSAKLTRARMNHLKFPKKTIDAVTHLIEHHMFNHKPDQSDTALRRFIARVGKDALGDLFELRRADVFGLRAKSVPDDLLLEFEQRIQAILKTDAAFSVKDLAVNGADLLKAGIPSGPVFTQIFNHLLDIVLSDPSKNTQEELLAHALDFYKKTL